MPPLPRHSCFLSFYSFITFALPKHGAMSRKVSSTIKSGNSFFVSIQEKVSPRSSKTFVVIIRTRQILASSNSFTCRKSSVSMAVYPILQRIEEGCIVHHRPHHRDEWFQRLSHGTEKAKVRLVGIHPRLRSKGISSSSHISIRTMGDAKFGAQRWLGRSIPKSHRPGILLTRRLERHASRVTIYRRSQ